MSISKIFLIASLLASSISFGVESRLTPREQAQREALYLFGMMDLVRNAVWRVHHEARYPAVRHAWYASWKVASEVAGNEAMNAAGEAAKTLEEASTRVASDAAINGDLQWITMGKATWEFVIAHQNDIKAAIDNALINVQMSNASKVDWGRIIEKYQSAKLDRMVQIGENFYVQSVNKINELASSIQDDDLVRPPSSFNYLILFGAAAILGLGVLAYNNYERSEADLITETNILNKPILDREKPNSRFKKLEAKVTKFFTSVDKKLLDVTTRLRNAKATKKPRVVIRALEKELKLLNPSPKILKKIERYEILRAYLLRLSHKAKRV